MIGEAVIAPGRAPCAGVDSTHGAAPSPWRSRLATIPRVVVDTVRRLRQAHRRRADARGLRDALQGLDDRTLRDLGFHRDEISSIAAEATGVAAPSRVRTLRVALGGAG
jgi:uncharacterized protein YjiS (DUF1127 family)